MNSQFRFGNSVIECQGQFRPMYSSTWTCGSPNYLWSAFYALNGVIRTAEGEYVGSFAAGENNSALNVNTSAPEQMSAIASLVADFTESLIAKA